MKKPAILATLTLLAPPMMAADEPCNPDRGGTFHSCLTHMLERIGQLETENQAQQADIQRLPAEKHARQAENKSLRNELVAHKKAFEEKLTLMSISRDGNTVMTFVDAKGTPHTLDLGDGNNQLKNEWIAYRPGNNENKVEAALYFNLSDSPSAICTLLHDDDDYLRSGFYFATDGGNNFGSIWGKEGIHTFALSRIGVTSYVIDGYASYQIFCVKP